MTIPRTILLAEDDNSIRKLIAAMLNRENMKVLIADSGEAAQEISLAYQGPIHLLLTDIVMPKITGKELADIICKVRKETRVVFMSGYPRGTFFENGVCHDKLFFLQKPFSMPVMLEMVKAVLEMPSSELKNADHG